MPQECVGALRAGDSFGELALFHSGVRNATIMVSLLVVLQWTYVACLF
jgi:hypothetical protein